MQNVRTVAETPWPCNSILHKYPKLQDDPHHPNQNSKEGERECCLMEWTSVYRGPNLTMHFCFNFFFF